MFLSLGMHKVHSCSSVYQNFIVLELGIFETASHSVAQHVLELMTSSSLSFLCAGITAAMSSGILSLFNAEHCWVKCSYYILLTVIPQPAFLIL